MIAIVFIVSTVFERRGSAVQGIHRSESRPGDLWDTLSVLLTQNICENELITSIIPFKRLAQYSPFAEINLSRISAMLENNTYLYGNLYSLKL